MPVAMETLGSWAPMALKFVKSIGSRIADSMGDQRAASFLFQSIGIAIQRGNAASIAGTVRTAIQRGNAAGIADSSLSKETGRTKLLLVKC